MAPTDGWQDARTQTGVGGKGGTDLHPETSGTDMNAVQEKTPVLEDGKSLRHPGTGTKRSRSAKRHFEPRIGLGGISRVMMAATVLGVLVLSVVAIRFIVCSRALVFQGVTPRSVLSGGSSRKLAGEQDGQRPSPLPNSNGESATLKVCAERDSVALQTSGGNAYWGGGLQARAGPRSWLGIGQLRVIIFALLAILALVAVVTGAVAVSQKTDIAMYVVSCVFGVLSLLGSLVLLGYEYRRVLQRL
ncbi:hypothetical protein CSUI_009352 [Cystoisospora suis]|uniref:Transmembrane protein n=1 Tax=Cystoisospora suis TaxID=483139 RepID=A0A2C6KI89_9APIC|nr:hypothetical protein CSUI_009352 [Cystoisospora suis]